MGFLIYFSFLLSGILASLTPCVLVLFPIVMYRFVKEDKIDKKKYLFFVLGFLSSFLLSGIVLFNLFNSGFKNGFQFALGLFLITLGVLEFMGKVDSLNFKAVKNTFLYGFIFSFAVSLSPCSLPFLGAMLGMGLSLNLALEFLLFGLGLLFPSFIFVFVSKTLLSSIKKTKKFMYYLSKFMSFVLIFTGIYVSLRINNLSSLEIYFSSFILILMVFFVFLSFVRSNNFSKLFTIPRFLLFLSLIFLVVSFTYNCFTHQVDSYKFNEVIGLETQDRGDGLSEYSCGFAVEDCSECLRCFYLFGFALFLAFLGNFLLLYYEYKVFLNKKD
jgi:cytochrome c biogenesis protein CcdA